MSDYQVESDVVIREKCPVCGDACLSPIGTECPEIIVTFSNVTFRQPRSLILDCRRCGLLFCNVVLKESVLTDYYGSVDHRKWEIDALFPTEEAVISLLKTLPPGAKILDFGCSSGRLLANLVNEYDCFGFEVNKLAAVEAANKGIRVIEDSDSLGDFAGVFDAIVMVDVFEHFSNPLAELSKLFQLLKPGGNFMIVTGNGDTPICRLDPAHFWYFLNVEHLCMLTRKHAEYLSTILGAKVIEWQPLCHYNHSLSERLRQRSQHFAYWQFRKGTLFSRLVLSLLPVFRRAKDWPFAPAVTCTRDHILFALQKAPI